MGTRSTRRTPTAESRRDESCTAAHVAGKDGLPRISEKQFQAQVIAYAKLRGYRIYHNPDSRRSTAGFPDLVLVRRPRVVFAELKTDTGRVRPEQTAWLDELRACGMTAVIWRPEDWPDVERTLL